MKRLLPIYIAVFLLAGCAAPAEWETGCRQIAMDAAVVVMEEKNGILLY